ncbi:MAG: helix-turn-helix transcriptional regulator [Wenzhouxiangella sp.]
MRKDRHSISGMGWLLLALGTIVILVGWDLFSDYREGVELPHVLVELTAMGLAGGMFIAILAVMFRSRGQLTRLRSRLDTVEGESRRWRERYQETIRGLGEATQEQFESWRLTSAEAEIALLLLKGLSLKEIASIRDTGERTVREQARAIYRKAGLSGRSELAAFFLEDLLLPDPGSLEQAASVETDHP